MADDTTAETPDPAPDSSSDKAKDGSGRNKLLTGAAIGIGSAALVAALLYANRRRSDRS